jgi:hypothetical protein
MRDWKVIATGLQVELTDRMRQSLEELDKTMLGLRGLIDWQEEPIETCHVPRPEDDTE